MKQIRIILSAAFAASLVFASCTENELTPSTPSEGKYVTVHFGANSSIESPTKATLTTEDEATFKSAWENGDQLHVEYSNDGESFTATTNPATWNGSSFKTTMPSSEATDWYYTALYPAPTNNEVDFGSARTQKGNAYNSKYDIMKGGNVAENAKPGEDENGKPIVFEMDRLTGIVYFHLTSNLDEEVVSAKLTATNANIATGFATLDYLTGLYPDDTKYSDNITITFEEGTAPKAKDFQLWFNVLPDVYSAMTLHVETTGHTLDITRTAKGEGGMEEFVAGKLYKTVKTIADSKWVAKSTPVVYSWIATELADIAADDEVVITMSKGETTYALSSANGSSSAPAAVVVEVISNELVNQPDSALVWNISNSNGDLTIYPNGVTDSWLYTTNSNNGVRVGDNNNKVFTISDNYLKNTKTERFVGVYTTNPDWRCYTSTGSNISGQTLCFYVKSTPKTALDTPANLSVSAAKVVSWDAVSGAASYNVTIGTETYSSETNSYDASSVEDEYYDVSVVAVPSDKDNYKNSAAATLSAVKFGTPTLATPVLKEGLVDDASVNVTWTADSRATNGYKCEIYNGETLVEAKDVTESSVEFTALTVETAYTVKVQAKAIEGTKAYAASEIATLSVTTKAAGVQANDGSLDNPYTAAEAITVIDSGSGLTGKHVKGVVAADPAPTFNSQFNSLTYYITSGGATIQIYSGRDLGDSGFVGTEDLNTGDEVVVFGDLYKYGSTYEMNKENYLISINGETEIYRGLSISGQKTGFTVGDTFEFGGKVLQVWRGKDDVDVTATATFSGYDMSAEGTQTVTVTVGEETLTYEIKVNPAGTVVEESETIDLAKGSYANNVITWSGTSCSFVQSKNTSNTAVNESYIQAPRWYAKHNISFTAKEGYTITKVEVTCTSSSYASALGNSTYTNGATAEVSSSVVTITTTGDFVITLGAQSRIKSVKVYYTN